MNHVPLADEVVRPVLYIAATQVGFPVVRGHPMGHASPLAPGIRQYRSGIHRLEPVYVLQFFTRRCSRWRGHPMGRASPPSMQTIGAVYGMWGTPLYPPVLNSLASVLWPGRPMAHSLPWEHPRVVCTSKPPRLVSTSGHTSCLTSEPCNAGCRTRSIPWRGHPTGCGLQQADWVVPSRSATPAQVSCALQRQFAGALSEKYKRFPGRPAGNTLPWPA